MSLISQLRNAISQNNIELRISKTPLVFLDASMRKIDVSINEFEASLFIDDEYKDIDSASPLLLLNMVLMECTWYLEEDDYLTWCTSKNLNPSNVEVRTYYMELGEMISGIKSLLPNIEHTSFFDWQLNAGDAQFLRRL